MSKCTAAKALEAMAYWLGYYEKASANYATTRDKTSFEKNKGSGNYTYAGHLCQCQGQPWCAMQISTALYEACGGQSDATAMMWGRWPHYNCGTVADDAKAQGRFWWSWYGLKKKGKSGQAYTPRPGDIIIFTDAWNTRDHVGMVYAVDERYVYTYEGNSSNQARKRSYLLTSSYIYGYARPNYADDSEPVEIEPDQYGGKVEVTVHQLSKGCAGAEVKTLQRILYARGIKDANGAAIAVDGDFGKNTKAATIKLQKQLGVDADGIVGPATWKAMLTELW